MVAQYAPVPPAILLAQDEEVQPLMARFQSQASGKAEAPLEMLVRAAVFKLANGLGDWLPQAPVDWIDAGCQPNPGEAHLGGINLRKNLP